MAKEKPSQGMLYNNVAQAMNGEPTSYLNTELFKWQHKLMLVDEPTSDAYTIIKVGDDKVCSVVSLDWVAQQLAIALKPYSFMGSLFAFDFDQIKKCARQWFALTTGIKSLVLEEHPIPVAFDNETHKLCYR